MKTSKELIIYEMDYLTQMLLDKNEAYGDSALEPCGIMAPGDALDLIAVRIDDKLTRIKNIGGLVASLTGYNRPGEDAVKDLIGYLVLARVAFIRACDLASPSTIE